MTTRITFLGVAGYDIEGPDNRILIDPFLSESPNAPCSADEVDTPDVILVSHAAFDHLGDTAAIAKRTGAAVVCGADVRMKLLDEGVPSAQVRATVWGIVIEVSGVIIRPVACHHWSQAQLKGGESISGVPMGFIVETEPGVRLYHYGDTAIFSDLRLIGELYEPTIGLLGCSQPQVLLERVPGPGKILTGEMAPREAALAAEMLKIKLAVACHYLDLENEIERRDVDEFLRAVNEFDTTGKREAVAPAIGETLIVDGTSHWKEDV